jgi:Holliday junction resolvasome RuvABC DNA-binding subunit
VPVAHSAVRDQLLDALIGLGFTSKESDKAINSTFSHLTETSIDPSTLEISELLKLALQSGKR